MEKEDILKIAYKDYEKYFPVDKLKEKGYIRKRCKICGKYFWTLDPDRNICGDHEPYSFVNWEKKLKQLDYIGVWYDFSKYLKTKGYVPIKRYPVVARWRDDLEFVIASIADFQPWVVKGIVDPPAKKLTIPQFCLRFNDIDNVGLTSRHYTGFIMIGQHAFVSPKEYDINSYFGDLFTWITSLGIPEKEIILHEDAWLGGGNAGTSIEFFVRGLEIANQVYMQFETNSSLKELENIKVLDMGMGQERLAWLLSKKPTSYETVFPDVLSYLTKNSNVELNFELFSKFAPYSYSLDIEESDFNEEIRKISDKLGIDSEYLKSEVFKFVKLFSLADHTRTLLVAISDGALPSNVGGGYNLRVIFRRAYGYYEELFSSADFFKIFELHASYLGNLYPELEEGLEIVHEVLENEIKKYVESKRRAKKIIARYKGKKIGIDELVKLYISDGIRPEDLGIIPPQDFYKKIIEFRKSSKDNVKKEREIVLKQKYPNTKLVYYEDEFLKVIEAKCLDYVGNYAIFDKTIFYPEGGGQECDRGWILDKNEFLKIINDYRDKITFDSLREVLLGIFGESGRELALYVLSNGISFIEKCTEECIVGMVELRKMIKEVLIEVSDVIKSDNVVLHKTSKPVERNKECILIINWERRKKLMMYHDAVHILNGALRRYYGKIIWQAGAHKSENSARLDVTYYRLPTSKEIKEIEEMVNRVVWENRKIIKRVMERGEAERKYGFSIYQGGVVPGKYIRIVEIENWDVEACGGTHGRSTSYIGFVKIKNVKKVSDSVVRFEIAVNDDALDIINKYVSILKRASEIARVGIEDVDKTIKKFFELWKKSEKEKEKIIDIVVHLIKLYSKDLELSLDLDEKIINTILSRLLKEGHHRKVCILKNDLIFCINTSIEEIEKTGYKVIRKGKIILARKV